jgi:hypothetical protein
MADRVTDLEALRDLLWASLAEAPASARAALAAQYRGTLAELAELAVQTEKVGDPLDEIAARRAARGVAASGSGRSSV